MHGSQKGKMGANKKKLKLQYDLNSRKWCI